MISARGMKIGQKIKVGNGTISEICVIKGFGSIELESPLLTNHEAGDSVEVIDDSPVVPPLRIRLNDEDVEIEEEEKKDGQDQEEETAQEQTEGRERNLMEDRTIMFPDHWWEPRVTTSEGLITVKMNIGMKLR